MPPAPTLPCGAGEAAKHCATSADQAAASIFSAAACITVACGVAAAVGAFCSPGVLCSLPIVLTRARECLPATVRARVNRRREDLSGFLLGALFTLPYLFAWQDTHTVLPRQDSQNCCFCWAATRKPQNKSLEDISLARAVVVALALVDRGAALHSGVALLASTAGTRRALVPTVSGPRAALGPLASPHKGACDEEQARGKHGR